MATLVARPLCSLIFCFVTFFLSHSAAQAQAEPKQSLQDHLNAASKALPSGNRVTAKIVANNGVTLLSQNSTALVVPASTQKLLTAIAAYHELGKDFRFKTALKRDNKGHVYFVFVGDPLFDRAALRTLLTQAKEVGMESIKGNIYLDGSRFDRQDWSNAQSWNDRAVCFAAPASAISLNHNCVKGNLKTGKLNSPASIYWASAEPIHITNETKVVKVLDAKRQLCELELTHNANNNYTLEGCTPQLVRPLPLSIAVGDPFSYAAKVIEKEIKRAGLRFQGKILPGKAPSKADTITRFLSEPLPTYLERMLKKSDNQVADSLLKTMGNKWINKGTLGSNFPGNFANGTAAVREAIETHTGIALGNAYIADGSGLSRFNLLNAEILSSLIAHIGALSDKTLYNALAISGVDGSLKYRRGLINKPLAGKIHAKSGYLRGIYNLAGFLENNRGELIQFAVTVDGFNLAPGVPDWKKTPKWKHPIRRFYEEFFEALYYL